jgi:dTDP-glucose 4,6-dehydratase
VADIGDGPALRRLFDVSTASRHESCGREYVDRSIEGPNEFVHTNIVGTFTLLQEALRFYQSSDRLQRSKFRLLHVSTDEVFGSHEGAGLFTERTPYSPNSPYSASKASADHLVRAWQMTYGLPTLVTNCTHNYGPYHFPESLFPT